MDAIFNGFSTRTGSVYEYLQIQDGDIQRVPPFPVPPRFSIWRLLGPAILQDDKRQLNYFLLAPQIPFTFLLLWHISLPLT